MNAIINKLSARILKLAFLFFSFFFVVDGCKEDAGPTGLVNSPAIPSVAGHYTGNGRLDYGPAVYAHDCSVAGDIAQSGSSFAGNWTWTITASTLGNAVVGRSTKMWFTGQITAPTVSVQETSFVALNWNGAGFDVAKYSGTLSIARDTIRLVNVLPNGQVYPVITAAIVKQ